MNRTISALVLVVILIVGGLFFLINKSDNEQTSILEKISISMDIDVITVDGCEYIKYDGYDGRGGITHKGNCKNPYHEKEKW